MDIRLSELQAILTQIEATDYSQVNSITMLNEWIFKLSGWIAFSGQEMANAKKMLNKAKVKAYDSFVFSRAASGLQITPTLAKDYANSKCDEEQFKYDVAERCNRACVHASDAVRTVISALKTEQQTIFQS